MGLKYKDNFSHIEPKNPKIPHIHRNSYYARKNGSGFMLGGCYYYEEWNWLMPVVEKIESLGFSVTQYNDYCCIENTHFRPRYKTQALSNKNKKDATWKSIIEFIKWYNEQNKK